jgi:hypothetical protein
MTETTARIRWERVDGTVTSWFGYVGSHKGPLFQILHPVARKPDARTLFHKWALAATFAQDEVRYPETAEGAQSALKAEAERWLERFVSSLGASFPDEPKQPSRAWHTDWAKADRDQDGNTILRHKPDGSLYKILPVEEC